MRQILSIVDNNREDFASPFKGALRDTEVGDPYGLDRIVENCDWQHNKIYAVTCSQGNASRSHDPSRQDPARLRINVDVSHELFLKHTFRPRIH